MTALATRFAPARASGASGASVAAAPRLSQWTVSALATGAALLGLLLLLSAARTTLRAAWRARRRDVRFAWARQGEERAADLLERRGYEVLASQVPGRYAVSVDGEPIAVDVRADYLVTKCGVRYVAEVKTGARAPRITTPATRRQLLEYRLAFDVDGILLVDMDAARIQAVVFPRRPFQEPRAGQTPWLPASGDVSAATLALILGALALGAAAGFTSARATPISEPNPSTPGAAGALVRRQ